MTTFIVLVIGAALLIGLYFYGADLEAEQYNANEKDFFENVYKEDIDFSLMVKGYPVVNDVDIRYTEWLAKNGQASRW